MEQILKDRVVVITGAGGALGRSHALAFAKLGACVVASDVVAESTDETVALITADGGRAVAAVSGVETWEGGQAIVDAALSAYGRLDILINNAGILRDKSFAKMTPDMVEAVLAVHLAGAFHVTKAAWPHLCERGGSVINTSSGSGLYGNYGQANYGAAKMGLVGFTRTLAQEGARAGVRANAIAPLARSAMTENLLPVEMLEKLSPQWVSPLVTWLASDSCTANGYIYSVGAGRYARVAILESAGVRFDHIPSISELAAAAAEIDSMQGATEPRNLTDQIALTAPQG